MPQGRESDGNNMVLNNPDDVKKVFPGVNIIPANQTIGEWMDARNIRMQQLEADLARAMGDNEILLKALGVETMAQALDKIADMNELRAIWLAAHGVK